MIIQRLVWKIAHSHGQTLINNYSSLHTPPIFRVKLIQTETIIAVVGICLLGLVQI